ncbi:hypothetical protein [Streptantibioticus ferralitis]|uniref:Uncharacterized protein n=1 Tax=Streptantibioticus ferralitis TaxID=236510 RepID=A0ABT5ZB89_9ACTN|nr:hypothetical protein [Streptantibioticus ferralitis]MDF2260897.1 hypothetical protein [Streptantibioticus ferralitis]
MSILRKAARQLPEERKSLDAGLTVAASMIDDNARQSLHDGRLTDSVADLVQASRSVQGCLYEAIGLALAEGTTTFEDLAAESHLSPEYLKEAYERFAPGMDARPGPDKNGREPWRVLG